jgi:DtxR family transcriptional regulator, Mn-dependent transcriptional regulator
MPTANREDYLKRIYRLQGRQGDHPVAMGKLAAEVGVSAGSATGMVKTLVEMGLVDYEPYVGVRLTDQGERIALHVLRRHRLIEAFLVKTLGLDWSAVDPEAEAIEHVVSEELLEHIDAFLGRPRFDPHGDPIPDAEGKLAVRRHQPLNQCEVGQRIRVSRVSDQDAAFLQFIDRVGLRPGAEATIEAVDQDAQTIALRAADREPVNLSAAAAAKVMVETM